MGSYNAQRSFTRPKAWPSFLIIIEKNPLEKIKFRQMVYKKKTYNMMRGNVKTGGSDTIKPWRRNSDMISPPAKTQR